MEQCILLTKVLKMYVEGNRRASRYFHNFKTFVELYSVRMYEDPT